MEEEFFYACEDGKVEDVIRLLQNEQININWQNESYSLQTPFHRACEKGYIEVVKLLLNDERVEIRTDIGRTSFHIACLNGHIEIVKLLLNNRIDINKADDDGWTPFHSACSNGYIEILKLLLNDKRVDLNKEDKYDNTPFLIACRNGKTEVVKYLLESERTIDIYKKDNKHGKSGLNWARENGNTDIAELIEAFQKNPNETRAKLTKELAIYEMQIQLWKACSDGKVEDVIRLLQNEQININWQNDFFSLKTPFHTACGNGHIEIAKIFLNDNRVDINKADNTGWTPFNIACQFGHIEIVKLLLNDERVDINKANNYGSTPFYIACEQGYIEIMKLLLNDNRMVDINKTTGYYTKGATPFFIACEKRRANIVKILLNDNRVDINKANNEGITPFYSACFNRHMEILKLLLDSNKVDINQAENKFGWTPFYFVCYRKYIEIVKLLLNDKRVDINKASKHDATPFYIACQEGDIEIAKLLLNDKRISIRKKTKEGKTAMDIAKEWNRSEIIKLIKEFDTDQRHLEYLETFQNSPFFCIENEAINKQDFLILNEYLKSNNNIKELRLINCDLTPSSLLEILKTLILKYENLQLSNIQSIEIDNIKLESTEGLEIIPIEIRNQGTKAIVQYILDLCKSPNSNPLYRTKLMVVGYENVGKTTILDCLFPLINIIEVPNFFGFNSEYYFSLEGKYLNQYHERKLHKQYIFENKEWSVTKKVRKKLFQDKNDYGIEIERIKKLKEVVELYFEDEERRDLWFERILKLVSNKATHGIEVNTHIWNSSTLNQLQNKNLEEKRNGNDEKKDKDKEVEYSTWDFAGQNDYYNTHHYFLSNRSIFLVLYRMDKGIKGLESLDFWLKSLSSHLNQNYCDENGKPFYSIIIVGTFLDSIINNNQNDVDKNLRQTKIMEIYDKNGLKSPPFYFEVSCSTLENIDELREIIFNNSLSHSYMGENVPVGYLTIEKSIYELRKLKQNHPIIEIQDLIDHTQTQYQSQSFEFDIEFVKRGLKLLHEWGICIYFDEPIELSNIIVLDPQHFTKNILGDLFKADESIRKLRVNGIIDYSQLNRIWNGPTNLIETYLSLLEKFEVCFILEDQQKGNESKKKSENQKKLIIPNLLSEDKIKIIEERLREKWPITIPRGEIEIERIFSFNQVPSEMVSRLLVRFHDKIVDNIIWRRGVLLKHVNKENENENRNENKNGNILCLLEVKMEENLFEIRIRGKERKECLEMMKYIDQEVKIVSENYKGVKWKECVRSPHFSKGLIDLNEVIEDCNLELKDRKLICPITHFPIYGEDLLFKTGLLDSLDSQNNIGNNYWNYSYENQNQNEGNQKSETEIIFENSQLNEKEYEKVEYLLKFFGFNMSKIDKVIGIENKEWKKSFEVRGKQIYGQQKDTPSLFKRENWIEQSEPELRKSFIQYLGDYISKFRKLGWNHGNNSFVIPMIQGTTEDAAWRICDNGFGTVCKVDAGYYSQGVYVTSKVEYAEKYCPKNPKVLVIGFVIVGNPFPVIEHPFKDQKNYLGKPINPGYQSHFTLVDGRNINSAFPITKAEKMDEDWIANELVVHDPQIYPSYLVYYK